MANNFPIPDTILYAPTVPDDQAFYWEAWNDLHTARGVGMDLGPIPWTAINDYAIRYRLFDEDEFSMFKQVIRTLDDNYVTYMKETRPGKKAPKKDPTTPQGR